MNLNKVTDAVRRFGKYGAVRVIVIIIAMLPLLLGFSVIFCGDYEQAQRTIIPSYLWDDDELIRKHLFTIAPSPVFMADRYGAVELESIDNFHESMNILAPMGNHIRANALNLRGHIAAIRDYNDYKNSLEPCHLIVPPGIARDLFAAFLENRYTTLGEELFISVRNSNDIPDWLTEAYPDEVERHAVLDSLEGLSMAVMNNELRSSYQSYDQVPVPGGYYIREPRWLPPESREWHLWGEFVRGLPGPYKWMPTREVYWRHFLRRKYNHDIALLNRAWDADYKGFAAVPFFAGKDGPGVDPDDWSEFVYQSWPRSMIELKPGHDAEWRDYLAERFANDDGMLAEVLDDTSRRFLALPLRRPKDPLMDVLWCDFIEAGLIPVKDIHLVDYREMFGSFLRSNYLGGRIVSLNEEWFTNFEAFNHVPLPLGISDLSIFPAIPEKLRKEYAGKAWFAALKSLRQHAGIINRTAVHVGALAGFSLLLSIVSAYVLARVPLRSSRRIAGWAVLVSLIPLVSWLVAGKASLTGTMAEGRLVTLAASGGMLLSVIILRRWFLGIIKNYLEVSRMDGIGEAGFIFRFVLRYSFPVILYSAFLHFVFIYTAIDWQVLAMGRLWNWTLGVWALNQTVHAAPVRAATALLGMIPVIIAATLMYPVLTRYSLVPLERSGTKPQ